MPGAITVVIVNWNSGKLLEACIGSIAKYHSNIVDSVVVVDNASSDESHCYLSNKKDVDLKLKLITNQYNRGFAVACNQGAALAESKYVLFLNPDARLFANSLEGSLEFMEASENAHIGVVGVQLVDEYGCVARCCSRFPSALRLLAHSVGVDRLRCCRWMGMQMSEWMHDHTRIVDQVIGAFFFVRRSLFEELNGFDERFFVYFEEVDFSMRLHCLGYRSAYLANVRAFHKGGGTSEQVRARRLFFSLRSRILYAYKHWGAWPRIIVLISTLLLEPVIRCSRAAIRGRRTDFWDTCRGFGMLYRSVPAILARRPAA